MPLQHIRVKLNGHDWGTPQQEVAEKAEAAPAAAAAKEEAGSSPSDPTAELFLIEWITTSNVAWTFSELKELATIMGMKEGEIHSYSADPRKNYYYADPRKSLIEWLRTSASSRVKVSELNQLAKQNNMSDDEEDEIARKPLIEWLNKAIRP